MMASCWLDDILRVNTKRYIRTGRKMLKAQKSFFIFDLETLVNLELFLNQLEMVMKNYDKLDVKNVDVVNLVRIAPNTLKLVLIYYLYGLQGRE